MMMAEADARRAGDHRTADQLRECVEVARFREQVAELHASWLVGVALAPQPVAQAVTADLLLHARDAVLDAPYRSAHRDPFGP